MREDAIATIAISQNVANIAKYRIFAIAHAIRMSSAPLLEVEWREIFAYGAAQREGGDLIWRKRSLSPCRLILVFQKDFALDRVLWIMSWQCSRNAISRWINRQIPRRGPNFGFRMASAAARSLPIAIKTWASMTSTFGVKSPTGKVDRKKFSAIFKKQNVPQD